MFTPRCHDVADRPAPSTTSRRRLTLRGATAAAMIVLYGAPARPLGPCGGSATRGRGAMSGHRRRPALGANVWPNGGQGRDIHLQAVKAALAFASAGTILSRTAASGI